MITLRPFEDADFDRLYGWINGVAALQTWGGMRNRIGDRFVHALRMSILAAKGCAPET